MLYCNKSTVFVDLFFYYYKQQNASLKLTMILCLMTVKLIIWIAHIKHQIKLLMVVCSENIEEEIFLKKYGSHRYLEHLISLCCLLYVFMPIKNLDILLHNALDCVLSSNSKLKVSIFPKHIFILFLCSWTGGFPWLGLCLYSERRRLTVRTAWFHCLPNGKGWWGEQYGRFRKKWKLTNYICVSYVHMSGETYKEITL